MSQPNRVTLDIQGHIAHVRLNRPDKHNGLDMPMFRQLIQTARKIEKNRDIRCVILAGEGASFCAGLDFSAIAKQPSMAARLFLKWPWQKTNMAQEVAHCWRRLSVPVISVIHGNCFGGGMQLIMASDIRIAHPDTRLSIMEIKWGLIPDMSGTIHLARLTREDIAKELTMTGRIFSASEGADYGLISHVSSEPMAQAEALAAEICAKSPTAIAATKSLFDKTWQVGSWRALFWERWTQARLLGRKNQRIAMQNGLAKDKPAKPFLPRN